MVLNNVLSISIDYQLIHKKKNSFSSKFKFFHLKFNFIKNDQSFIIELLIILAIIICFNNFKSIIFSLKSNLRLIFNNLDQIIKIDFMSVVIVDQKEFYYLNNPFLFK